MSAIGAATVEALIFDMDGLLVDSETLNEEVLQALLREHDCQIEWTAERVEALIGRRMPEALAVIAGICDITVPVDALNASFEELRLVVLRGRLQTMPGARELIAHGRAAGLRLALATSGRRDYVDAVLTETGLTGWFDAEVTGEEVTRGKPAPDAYLLAAQRLEINAGACIVFEDAPNGIAAAVAAGMRAVAVPNVYTRDLPFRVSPPEATLPDLHAAIPWLKRHMLTTDALTA